MATLTQADIDEALAQRKPLRNLKLEGATLEGLVFGAGREEENAAVLEHARFRGATLRDVRFARCSLTDVDLRGATLVNCDFRYASFARTTFADADIEGCDFYRAFFDTGTVFRPKRLRHVSLTNAWLQGASGMSREHFRHEALVQEAGEGEYRGFLERTRGDSPLSTELARVGAARFTEAAQVYRALSGLWSSQGLYGDSGWAYARSRELERRDASPRHAGTANHVPRWLALSASRVVSGYGLSVPRVARAIAAVWLLPALVYGISKEVQDSSDGHAGTGDTLLFSLGQLTSSAPERLGTQAQWVEWLGTLQILGGVTLLGLLGFVLGNAIRSS